MYTPEDCTQVSAVTAVGLVEGSSHVNWKMLFSMLLWWTVGFALVMVCTSALVAQGHLHLHCGLFSYCITDDSCM